MPIYHLWCDLETTGLDPNADEILEVAFKLTDSNCNELWKYTKALDVMNDDYVLERLKSNKYVFDMHTKNGLLDSCKLSACKLENVVDDLYKMINSSQDKYGIDFKRQVLLSGSSIHFDRWFFTIHAPEILDLIHYRVFDVSSLLVLADRLDLDPSDLEPPKAHRAMDDIERSIGIYSKICETIGKL